MANILSEKIYALFSSPTNKKLIFELEKKNAKVFRFPPIETEKTVLDSSKIECLRNISNFDWVIFTDVFAVDYFLQALEENDIDYFEMDAARVCAFGEAVSDRLRFVQLHADIIPNSLSGENIFLTLLTYTNDEIQDLRFLAVKENSREFEIKDKLEKKGANVFELPIYTAKITDKNEIVKLKTLIKGGAIDEFVLSSAEDFIALRFYFAGETVAEILSEMKISVTSENIFQTAKENNLRPLYFHF